MRHKSKLKPFETESHQTQSNQNKFWFRFHLKIEPNRTHSFFVTWSWGEIFQCVENTARYTKCNNIIDWKLEEKNFSQLYYDTWCSKQCSWHTRKLLRVEGPKPHGTRKLHARDYKFVECVIHWCTLDINSVLAFY